MRPFLSIVLLAFLAPSLWAQADPCAADARGRPQSRDLFCIPLSATAEGGSASGTVWLDYIPGPFTVPLTVDGHYRYRPRIAVRGTWGVGRGKYLVAWAASPTMDSIERLGVVPARGGEVGEITLDRFMLLISRETDSAAHERTGPVVLRGESPSNRMRPPDVTQLSLGGVVPLATGGEGWHGVPMTPHIPMLPAEMGLAPASLAWRPATTAVPEASAPATRVLRDGDTIVLEAALAHRTIAGQGVVLYAVNGEQPAPTLVVTRGSHLVARLINHLDRPTSIHWHGIRLDNAFDGTAGLTQRAIAAGDSFDYRLRFPDSGIFWYHPHVREDIEQGLGLYGNILVVPRSGPMFSPANREERLILSDVLLGDDGPVPWGKDAATHALMGRFGNVLLVNGGPRWSGHAHLGDVVRFYLTDAANARTFNISFGGAPMKLSGADLGPYEHEVMVPSVVIGPAERYVVAVRFDHAGPVPMVNHVRVLDRLFGRFIEIVDTLGIVDVDSVRATPDFSRAFAAPVRHAGIVVGRPTATRQLLLTMRTEHLPFISQRLMAMDSAWFAPVEWGAAMPAMNLSTTTSQVHWVLRDPATGREGMNIGWHFRRGTLLELRITNDRDVLHGMQHPIHLHGQRFLVLAVNGTRNTNLAWKDTVLIPSGASVLLLVDLSNPGQWMLHCHIAEHLESGMMTSIAVD